MVKFENVERGLSLYLRALWGCDFRLRPASHTKQPWRRRRATIDGDLVRLPQACAGLAGQSGAALYRAAAAHAAAHVRFTTRRFSAAGLTPIQVAVVSLIEDARVECLAIREFPGLKHLWAPFHVVRGGAVAGSAALMVRLARALIDQDYQDDDPWVREARRRFFAQCDAWQDQSVSRAIGSLLGGELERMREPFDFATYVVEPAYRDDNLGMWDFANQNRNSRDDSVHEGVHSSDGDEGEPPEERASGDPAGRAARSRLFPGRERSEAPEERLSPAVRYDEWDYLVGRERRAWCTLLEKSAAEGDARQIDDMMKRNRELVTRMNALVRALLVKRLMPMKLQLEGERLDLDASINALVDLRSNIAPDLRVHTLLGRRRRDLSVLVLLDLSQSTNDLAPGAGTTVLQLAREATALLADAMERIGDSFAIHGFFSNGRHEVGYVRIKDFDRPYAELAKARLAGITGRFSTRIGTALRHAGSFLKDRRSDKKLLLLVTDGEPSDIDVQDPHYLVFDVKKAVEQNQSYGVYTYCMSLDPRADCYVSRIFGVRNWTVVDHLRRLPEKLPLLYVRLTH